MNIINFENVSYEFLNGIIERAIKIKKEQNNYNKVLKGLSMYMLFEKTSTRTALSFDRAMVEMGGSVFLQKYEDSNFCIGEIQDEVRYVSKNVDIIMARMKNNESINCMAKYATIPVINGCCDKYHPCQAMADMLTIKEKFGRYAINMLYIGVWNNVCNSLVETLPVLGGKLYVFTPVINPASYDEQIINSAVKTGNLIQIDSTISQKELKDIVKDMDVVYTDTWMDLEFFNNKEFEKQKQDRIEIMLPYQVNDELLAGSNAIVMHDMPMHPGYEISRDTIEKHIDTILLQGENRKHAQKGIIIEAIPLAMQRFKN